MSWVEIGLMGLSEASPANGLGFNNRSKCVILGNEAGQSGFYVNAGYVGWGGLKWILYTK